MREDAVIIVPVLSSAAGPGPTDGHGSDYAALSRRVRAAGLLDSRRGSYVVHIAVVLGFFAATCGAVGWLGNSWWQLILAVVLGVAFTQVALSAMTAGTSRSSPGAGATTCSGSSPGTYLSG